MAKGKALTSYEKGQVDALQGIGFNITQIANKINRSRCAIRNYLNLGTNYDTERSTGRKSTLGSITKKKIIHLARVEHQNSTQIKVGLQLNVTSRRVRQILSTCPTLKYIKKLSKPKLTQAHKTARLQFARKYMDYSQAWENVLFSDEKKFNLDGPDGAQYYWHDIRDEREVRMSRNYGGGSLMIWGAFSIKGKLPLAFITTKMNSKKYTEMLETSLIDHAEEIIGCNFTFQQDNASIHRSAETMAWLHGRHIPLLDWPACSPDLNPIENLWGIMVRRIYENGKQYSCVIELKEAIKATWKEIEPGIIQKLVGSMPSRIFSVIQNSGGHTKY